MASLPDDLDRGRTVIAVAMTLLAIGLVTARPAEPFELAWFAALTVYFWLGAWTPIRVRIPIYNAWGGLLFLGWAAYQYTSVGATLQVILFGAVGLVVIAEALYSRQQDAVSRN